IGHATAPSPCTLAGVFPAWARGRAPEAPAPPIGCCKHRSQELVVASQSSIRHQVYPGLTHRGRCRPRSIAAIPLPSTPASRPALRSSSTAHRSIPCAHHHAPALNSEAYQPDPPPGADPLSRARPRLRSGWRPPSPCRPRFWRRPRRLHSPRRFRISPSRDPAGPCTSLAEPRPGRAVHEGSWDRNDKNNDSIPVKPGETVTLFNHEGAGCVHRFWVTISPRTNVGILSQVVLRMYWDGDKYPSVECPIGAFVGQERQEQRLNPRQTRRDGD